MVTASVEKRRLEDTMPQTDSDSSSDQSCCASYCSSPQQYLRIATWPKAAESLQYYANIYNSMDDTPKVLVETLPSIQDLKESIEITQASLAIDSRPKVDGYVVPPMLLGTLSDDLSSLDVKAEYLPVYQHLTTVDGKTAAIPLFAGNQLLLFYKKDLLLANGLGGLAPPNTWEELTEFANKLNTGSTAGLCLGRMSEQACRRQSSLTGMPCHSQSMSYWSMVLATFAQTKGSSSGWLFYVEANGRFKPLLNQTLGPALEVMEEQLLYGGTNPLEQDASDNLQSFRDGTCAMTILADHPMDLLTDPNVGVAALPGSPWVLDRPAATSLGKCTYRNCTYGRLNPNQQGQGVNRAPIGTLDLAMGTILDASNHQDELKDFFHFVEQHRSSSKNEGPSQPLTDDELKKLTKSNPELQAYADLIESSASNPNAVWPLTIPASLDLMSELDEQVYDYLMGGNYTVETRDNVVRQIDKAWNVQIQQQDSRILATPLSILYQRSLQGVLTEQKIDLYIGTGFRILGWTMGGIACFMALGFSIWVYDNLENRVVQASQPLFLWLICAGAFIMASCIFPFGIEDDIVSYSDASIACMSSMWQYGLGFVMMVSALYSKIWRINRIFRYQHKIQRIRIEQKHILLPFGFLFSINFLVLLIWTISDPYEWIREEATPGFTNGFCYSENYWYFLAILVFANLLVACYTLIQAFECRKLSTEYEESFWICFSLACVVQIWLIGLPILQLTGDTPDWLFLTKTCIVFFTVVSTLLCIFVPKIQFLEEEARLQKEVAQKSAPGFESGRSSIIEAVGKVVKPFQSTFGMIRLGSQYMVSRTSQQAERNKTRSSGVIGIRIVRASGQQGQDMEKLQQNLKSADARRQMLQDQLESLQERFEQYIVSNHPQGAHAQIDTPGNSQREEK